MSWMRHKTFVANDIDAIAEVFPDHELMPRWAASR
jgi:hypothetical protein